MLKLLLICALQTFHLCTSSLPLEAWVLLTVLPPTWLSTSEKTSTESKTRKMERSCSQSVQVTERRTAQFSRSVGQNQGCHLQLRAHMVGIQILVLRAQPWIFFFLLQCFSDTIIYSLLFPLFIFLDTFLLLPCKFWDYQPGLRSIWDGRRASVNGKQIFAYWTTSLAYLPVCLDRSFLVPV